MTVAAHFHQGTSIAILQFTARTELKDIFNFAVSTKIVHTFVKLRTGYIPRVGGKVPAKPK